MPGRLSRPCRHGGPRNFPGGVASLRAVAAANIKGAHCPRVAPVPPRPEHGRPLTDTSRPFTLRAFRPAGHDWAPHRGFFGAWPDRPFSSWADKKPNLTWVRRPDVFEFRRRASPPRSTSTTAGATTFPASSSQRRGQARLRVYGRLAPARPALKDGLKELLGHRGRTSHQSRWHRRAVHRPRRLPGGRRFPGDRDDLGWLLVERTLGLGPATHLTTTDSSRMLSISGSTAPTLTFPGTAPGCSIYW